MALNNLGNRYSEVGRPGGTGATDEAVTSPAHWPTTSPRLPTRPRHGVEQPRQPLQRGGSACGGGGADRRGGHLYRALAEENPAYLPDLARALNNLGIRYSAVGRRADAVAPTEEAVTLRRVQAEENPALPTRPRHGVEQPRQLLQRGGPARGGGGTDRRSGHLLPGTGRGEPCLPTQPRHGVEQPRQLLQRGGPAWGGGGADRRSGQPTTGHWPRRTLPTYPTSPWR